MTDSPLALIAIARELWNRELIRAQRGESQPVQSALNDLAKFVSLSRDLADALESALADTRRIDRLTEALDIVHSPQLRDAYGASISVVLTLANSVPEPTVRQLLDMAWGEP